GMPIVMEAPDSGGKISDIRTVGVRENIDAAQVANSSPAVNIAADYAHTGRVRIIENRIGQAGWWSRLRAGALNKAFFKAPPVVSAAARIRRQSNVNLFPSCLSHVSNKHPAGLAIPTGSPRIAQAIQPNLLFVPGRSIKRIVWRDRVGARRGLRVNAQHFTEQSLPALSVSAGRVARTVVARAAAISVSLVESAISGLPRMRL